MIKVTEHIEKSHVFCYKIDIPKHIEKGGSIGRTLITRALCLGAEFATIYALYYGYALVASAEIPLHILTMILIATDRLVETIRAGFEAKSRK